MKEPKKKQQNSTTTVKLNAPVSFKKYYYLFGIITFFLFANTIGNDYNMDDGLVTRNHKLTSQGLGAIKEIFTSSYYDDGVYAYGYRPMVHLSFALEHELFGEKPGAGHFINIILFVLSAILFFKLLIKWVGEKNVLFAGIATLLFVAHPIHTEVVASLKNRDEILAFLFVIWAGLSAHKFLEKGKWISLILIFVLFSLAMLSKKSIYPMAIVLPIAIILSKELNIRQFIQIVSAFVIPAALIGSDFQWGQTMTMIAIPLALIAFAYFFKRSFLIEEKQINVRVLLNNWIIPAFFTIIITFASIYTYSFSLLCLTIPFMIWLFRTNFQIGIVTLTFSLIGIDLVFKDTELRLLLVLINVGYFMYLLNRKGNYKQWILPTAFSILYFLINHFSILNVVLILNALLFFWLIYTRIWLGICFAMITLGVTFFTSKDPGFYSIITISFSLLVLLEQKVKSFPWSSIVPVVAFSVLIISQFSNYELNTESTTLIQKENKQAASSQLPKDSDSFLKEGRTLLYVENTLVAPHSTSEKIATGFSTLGEYLYLHLFPKELSFYYGFSKTKTTDLKVPTVWLSIFIHLLLIGIAIWQVKKRPLITIGVLWYCLSILLFSNWVELVAGMVGERLAFTASAGFCILITALLFWVKSDFNIKKPGVIGAILGIFILLLAGRTITRNKDWKNSLTLMGHDMKHLSNSAQANNLYAMSLMGESVTNKTLTSAQKLEIQRTAISHFDQATAVWSDFYNVYIDKAKATMLTGDYQKGLESLEQAKRVDPKNALTYYVLLEITERNGDYVSYLKSAEELFKISQTDHAYGVVARGYFLLKNYAKSKEILIEGIAKHPQSDVLKNNLRIVEEKLN